MDPEHRDHPARVIGRYALYGKLASGGMATVHFGRLLGPAGFSRTVAIKRLHPQFAKDPEFVAMFLDEARLAARIQHPNVVATVDVVALSEELFLVMDYIRGESFSRLMRASRKRGIEVSLGVVASIISGMLHGLHAAHEARDERGQPLSVVHRDVSPQNVLVGVDGIARVLDFGVAKAAARIQITRDGQMKGKLSYMAPEQLQGKLVDRRTDIFAAGIVLWEALTGRRLFDAEEASEVLRMIASEEIPPPSAVVPSISRDVDEIVMRALSRNTTTRYQTAREFAIALEEAVPLASPREVGEWVELVAGDTLLHREQAVAEIEAVSQVSDVSWDAGSVASVRPFPSGTPPPRTIPDASKPWDDDDPTRISTSSVGSSTRRDRPTRIQVPRPSSHPPLGVPPPRPGSSRPPGAHASRPRTSRPPPLPSRRSNPPPILGPEHIGFGALMDDEARTNVIEPIAGDDERTSLYDPAVVHKEVPAVFIDDAEPVPAERAIVIRERISLPEVIVLHSPDYEVLPPPSAFAVAIGWLWDNPRQRTWRVAAAAGTFAMLVGFGVAAGRGGRPKSHVTTDAHGVAASPAVAVPLPPLAAAPSPVETERATPTPSPSSEAEKAEVAPAKTATPNETVEAKAAVSVTARPSAERASSRTERTVASHELEPVAQNATAEHERDLTEENPYTAPAARPPRETPPKPEKPAPAPAAEAPASLACRQPFVIDAQGIRRIKPECL